MCERDFPCKDYKCLRQLLERSFEGVEHKHIKYAQTLATTGAVPIGRLLQLVGQRYAKGGVPW